MSYLSKTDPAFSLLDHLPIGACVLRHDLTIAFWNSCLEEWTQLPREQVLDVPIHTLFPHLNQPQYINRFQQTLAGGQTTIFSSQLHPHLLPAVLTNGQLRVQHTTLTPISVAGESRGFALMSVQDVTDLADQIYEYEVIQAHAWAEVVERKRTEAALQESEALYRQMFEDNRTVQLLIDPQSSAIVDANPAALQFYGYSQSCLKQMQITELNDFPSNRFTASTAKLILTCPGEFLLHHRLASGEVREVEVYSSLVQLKGQELLYSIIHDVTDRRRAEQAVQLYREKERLIALITEHIRRSLNLDDILQTTVNEVRKFLQADRVIIYQIHPTNHLGSVLVESCVSNCLTMMGCNIGYAHQQADCIQSHNVRQTQAIADMFQSDDQSFYQSFHKTFEIRAKLSIPILQGNTLWGFLIAHCHSVRDWQQWEIDLLERLEDQLAVAIQQAELYQQVQQLNSHLEAKVTERTLQLQRSLDLEALLKRITDKVRDSLDEDQILQTAVEELGKGLNVACCDTGIYDLERAQVTIWHEYSLSLPSAKEKVIDFTTNDIFQRIHQHLMKGETLQFCLITENPIRPTEQRFTILACPIFDDQGTLGDLWLFQHNWAMFDELEIRLVQQVANQCAIALRQSRLYQTAQEQVEALAKLNQLKSDFLSTVSHELRTPLSSIKMSLQVLDTLLLNSSESLNGSNEAKSAATAPIHQCMKVLHEECDREINLVSDLLALQQLEAGTQPVQPISICLEDWLPQVIESFEHQTEHHQQVLRIEIDRNLPPLISDLFMLTRILTELLTNACKFTPAGGKITIGAALSNIDPSHKATSTSCFQISITNTGVEIPAHELDLIFHQFYRIPSNDPWKHGGTGIGLALVKKLVHYLGGAIQAESQSGQTCFTIELPYDRNPELN